MRIGRGSLARGVVSGGMGDGRYRYGYGYGVCFGPTGAFASRLKAGLGMV
jgi:hypothetical protein